MNAALKNVISKLPEVTLVFWLLKIIATTLVETGGDALYFYLHCLSPLFLLGIVQ